MIKNKFISWTNDVTNPSDNRITLLQGENSNLKN